MRLFPARRTGLGRIARSTPYCVIWIGCLAGHAEAVIRFRLGDRSSLVAKDLPIPSATSPSCLQFSSEVQPSAYFDAYASFAAPPRSRGKPQRAAPRQPQAVCRVRMRFRDFAVQRRQTLSYGRGSVWNAAGLQMLTEPRPLGSDRRVRTSRICLGTPVCLLA